MKKICSVAKCDAPVHARGWCAKHYRRWRAHGDPLNHGAFIVGDDEARFISYVRFDEELGCQVWTGGKDPDGYGRIYIDGEDIRAHRYQYQRHHGAIPDDLCVLHSCHNGDKACVDIRHLRLGTEQDNADDRNRAGRQARGDRHGCSKLCEVFVLFIRDHADYFSRKELSLMFGVSEPTIRRVISRKNWTHI